MKSDFDLIKGKLTELADNSERNWCVFMSEEGVAHVDRLIQQQWLQGLIDVRVQSGSYDKDKGRNLTEMLNSENMDDFELAKMIINQK